MRRCGAFTGQDEFLEVITCVPAVGNVYTKNSREEEVGTREVVASPRYGTGMGSYVKE